MAASTTDNIYYDMYIFATRFIKSTLPILEVFFIYLVSQQITDGNLCFAFFAYHHFMSLDDAISYYNSIKTKVPVRQLFCADDYLETEVYVIGIGEDFLLAYCRTDCNGEVFEEKVEEEFIEDFTEA